MEQNPPVALIGPPYVFISYARADQGYVTDLVKHLNDHGVVCWVDTDTDYGDRWPKVIRGRVDGCAALVVVMTPTSEESEWVEREIVRAQQRDKAILPLLLDGLPFFELNTTQYEDVSDARMPTPTFIRRLKHLTSTASPTPVTDPTIPDRGKPAFQFWLDEGQRLIELDQIEAALTAFTHAATLDPTNAYAHHSRGYALNELGRRQEALTAVDRAIELDPTNAYAHYNRGNALNDLGRHQEALTALDRAIELDPTNAPAHNNRGNTLNDLGRHQEALTAVDRAIELDPTNTIAHNNRGNTLNNLGRHQEALTALDRAIELDPTNAYAHHSRDAVLRRRRS